MHKPECTLAAVEEAARQGQTTAWFVFPILSCLPIRLDLEEPAPGGNNQAVLSMGAGANVDGKSLFFECPSKDDFRASSHRLLPPC
jgi:hypothetical protein